MPKGKQNAPTASAATGSTAAADGSGDSKVSDEKKGKVQESVADAMILAELEKTWRRWGNMLSSWNRLEILETLSTGGAQQQPQPIEQSQLNSEQLMMVTS